MKSVAATAFTLKAVGDVLQMLPSISAIHNAHCRRSHRDNQFLMSFFDRLQDESKHFTWCLG
jgi:hypothetical protein